MSDPTKNIRIGTMVPGTRAGEAIRHLLPHGFESFQPAFGPMTAAELGGIAQQVKEAIGDSDAVVNCLGVYGNPLETGENDVAVARMWETLIDNADKFGATVVSGFSGRVRGKSIEESLPRFKEVFEPLAKRAADKGVRLAFENCDCGGDWKTGDLNMALYPAAWEKMFDAVPLENIGLEWEPCHQLVKLIDPMPQLRKWVGRVFHVHGKDATVLWDVVREYGVGGAKPFAFHRTPGFGDSNWTDIISELRRGGFKGSVDIEGWHDPVYNGELEVTGQVHALEYLKRCRGGSYIPNY
jgi:sugar phosphate isomerase/epimerase